MKRKYENPPVFTPAKKQRTYQQLKDEPRKDGSIWYEMALCCEQGTNGVPKNAIMAFDHCSEAARLGYQPAVCRLAEYHQQGFGTPANFEKAFQLFSSAAAVDYGNAYLPLAYCYHHGNGTDENPGLALTYFSLAAEIEEPDGMYMMGIYHEGGIGIQQNYELAFTWFYKASQHKHVWATGSLAVCYKYGFGVKADPDLAFTLFKLAADNDDGWIQFELSLCYLEGSGTEKNAAPAIPLLQKGVTKGFAAAQYKLGECCLKGWGIEQNIFKGQQLIQLAADNQYPDALHWMGLHCKSEPKKAFDYFQNAAEKGHVESQYQLGCCYKLGLGVESDLKLAFQYYQKSAPNHSEAMYQLGHCYRNGHGVAISFESSVECYQAVVQSKPEANKDLYELGLCFLNGQGVEANYTTALPLLGAAIKAGFIDAQFDLALYYETVVKNETMAIKGYEQYAELKCVEQSIQLEEYDLGKLFFLCATACKNMNKHTTLKYLELAVQFGNGEAQYRLGDMYSGICFSDSEGLNRLPVGIDIDIFKAIELYKKSASQGNPVAKTRLDNMEVQFMVGYFFEFIIKDLAKAQKQYIWVAEQLERGPLLTKTRFFLNRISQKIAKDNPVQLPVKHADMDINNLIKIADEGISDAQYTVGLHYKNEANKPVPSSSMAFFPGMNASDIVRIFSEKASKYFKLAANQGHEKAISELETMNQQKNNLR